MRALPAARYAALPCVCHRRLTWTATRQAAPLGSGALGWQLGLTTHLVPLLGYTLVRAFVLRTVPITGVVPLGLNSLRATGRTTVAMRIG